MPKRYETPELSEGDQTWLASTRGITHNRTVKLNVASFDAEDNYPDGFIPSGTPLAIVDSDEVGEEAVPYDATEGTTTGAGVLAGFLFTDQVVDANSTDEYINAPLLDHGRIRISRLPIVFVNPAAAAKRANALFTYDVS